MSLIKQVLWLVAFSVAMGFLEAAVVIYLRLLYYPNGFQFPLVVMGSQVGLVEILREAATVVMLLGVGMLAGHSARQRLAFFIMAFAIWDLFYYVFLKLILDWPTSFFSWDILFLIPAPWVGPVLSPVIVCFTMLLLSWIILKKDRAGAWDGLGWKSWLFILSGSLVIIISWMWDYIAYTGRISDSPDRALEALSTYVPVQFNWWLFVAGEVLAVTGIVLYYKSSNR